MPYSKKILSNKVPVHRIRELIEDMLRRWGVSGIYWSEDYDSGVVSLRFRWKKDSNQDVFFIARLSLDIATNEDLRKEAMDMRASPPKFSQIKYDRLLNKRGKREHRLLHNFLCEVFSAIEEDVVSAEQFFFPYLEDAEGVTLHERIGPVMSQLTSMSLFKALESTDDK